MHIAIWIVTLLFAGLWTLLAWGLSSVLALDSNWLTPVEPWLARLPFAGWLEGWIPDWLQIAQLALDAVRASLVWLGGAAPVLVWALWLAGTLLLVLLAGALSLLVVLIRKSTAPPPVATA